MSSYDLKGKSAVVTGAGSGINYALTKYLLEAGCSVMMADIRLRPEAETLLSKYPRSGPVSAIFQPTDASLKAFGQVNIVCNGAGIYEAPSSTFWNSPGISPLAKDDPEGNPGVYQTFAVHTLGPIRLAQLAVDYWLEHREVQGSLFFIASAAAYHHSIHVPLYYASKAAILSFSTSLKHLRLATGIRVATLCPGIVRTPLLDSEYCRGLLLPTDVALTPEDCAAVAMQVLTGPQYGDGNAIEVILAGERDAPRVAVREIPLESLQPAPGLHLDGHHMKQEAEAFLMRLAQKGMRRYLEG
ncbi:NAD(P)-binding protein [Xylariaceae sp. FL0016]|nr:NAD(P)-binding protein [Xylariaceae sp. FL0016]